MAVIIVGLMLFEGGAWGLVLPPPFPILPLNQVPVPGPPNLTQFVKNVAAARKLGKAFFWDMQTGSDGVQSCATCHFRAGADSRLKNQLNPGSNGVFDLPGGGPNTTLSAADFPFHKRQNPDFQNSPVVSDVNDVVGSQGIKKATFVGVTPGSRFDIGNPVADQIFNLAGNNTRQVTGRNTPSVINAAFNFANFWDGRANNIFNGENPFGPADPNAGVWLQVNGSLVKQPVAILNASLASQATGPPLSDVEMSFAGRTFPDLGRKMLTLTPLDIQFVHPADSLLGSLSKAVINADGTLGGQRGLNTTYVQMIKDAFQDVYWNSNATTTGGFTQMEANFSLFWGLAVQLYEMTLISDQTPFDKFLAGNTNALTPQQFDGLGIFYSGGRCFECHSGPELTGATFTGGAFVNNNVHELINFMFNVSGISGIYDEGYYNIGVRPTSEDQGRGGSAPFFNLRDNGNPIPFSFSRLAQLQALGKLPFLTPILPPLVSPLLPTFTNGAFKVPSLRNVELTPPYFHNGGDLELVQTVDFYSRGGNFPETNVSDLPPAISQIDVLADSPERMDAMIAFLKSLTDERVRNESAPFDHPELFIPIGEPEEASTMIWLPATDAQGHAPPLQLALTTNQPSPAVAGNPVVFSANAGSPEYQYRFWLYNTSSGSWSLAQDYGVGTSWTLPVTTSAGSYMIAVDARRSQVLDRDAVTYLSYELSAPVATSVTITPDTPSPSAGTPVIFTANAGAPGFQYRFWLNDGVNWQIVQEYSVTSTWTLPASQPAGNYMLAVEARGSTLVNRDTVAYLSHQVAVPPASSVTITADQSVHTPGTDVIFTAAGQGASGYDYRFWLYDGAAWTLVQDYGNGSAWTMVSGTASGNYVVAVDVRTSATVARDAVQYLSYQF